MKILDLGCGGNKIKGSIGVDKVNVPGVDVLHDLNVYPLPFEDNQFDMIFMNHIIEHIDDIFMFMREVYRIAKHKAVIKGVTPHFSCLYSYCDPAHKHHLSFTFFDHLCNSSNWKKYRLLNATFKVKRIYISFGQFYSFSGISYLCNKLAYFYEMYFSGIFKAGDIHFELEILK